MIGFQEHDLRLLKMISYHMVYPIKDTQYLYAKSYNTLTSKYEGYQYGYYETLKDIDNPFEGWEPRLYRHWVINNCDLTLMHEAYTPEGKLVKKDLRVIWNQVPNLMEYYPNLEKIDIVNDLIQSHSSYHVNFQFYLNGNISIELFSGSWDYKLPKESYVNLHLITKDQYQYIIQPQFKDQSYSIKFKWNDNKITEKFYIQDVDNWQWI